MSEISKDFNKAVVAVCPVDPSKYIADANARGLYEILSKYDKDKNNSMSSWGHPSSANIFKNQRQEVFNLVLEHYKDENPSRPLLYQPGVLPPGHPAGYVPPKNPTQDSLEKQLESVEGIEVLPAVNVRKRTAAEREQDRSVRSPSAAKKYEPKR